jgi:Ni,Fe-hydrogenase III large subunit
MSVLGDLLQARQAIAAHRPWPRVIVNTETWRSGVSLLRDGELVLLGLWGDVGWVHLALRDRSSNGMAVLSLDCAERHFPSVGRLHPPAIRLERAIRDLFGLEAEGAPDTRPWLVHGSEAYRFLPTEGEGLHQVAVGPVHAGTIEPGHFRFTANGETVARLEERLGYAHKGTEALMAGSDLARAAKLAGRVSGDSTVAYAYAFARAVESALEIEPPPRAVWLRALMAELERLANHLGDIGAICNDASFALMHAHCGVLRERVLRAADATFGHRLMRDCVVPGGTAVDLTETGIAHVTTLADEIAQRFPPLVALYDNKASLLDRTVGTGILRPTLARQFGAGGYVGRASGQDFDARRTFAYPPYDRLQFEVPVRDDGDVNARVWIRIREVEQSLSLVRQILAGLPDGPVHGDVAMRDEPREGMALVEGFRGDILIWLRIGADGRVARCHPRDPSWFQWPLLEAAIEGNIVADFPLCNKSFNCSYSGHDL